jgi:hypothetical protein
LRIGDFGLQIEKHRVELVLFVSLVELFFVVIQKEQVALNVGAASSRDS